MKKSKKGFTLAELLIVVAIIAVLTAIAVPLFVGLANDAESKVGNANIRAVKGLAIAEILMDTDHTKYGDGTTNGWNVSATVDANGAVSNLDIKAAAAPDKAGTSGTPANYTEAGAWSKDGSNYKITVLVKTMGDTTSTGPSAS